jgi:molybdopterin-containing oxidoreductase family iron-sulfur binding subunit
MSDLSRRTFLKITGSTAAGAVATGCYRYSEIPQKILPYVTQPEEITPGIPVYYASTCTGCGAGCGLHVKTREGRPIKLEGNPDHPVNRGALCARGQSRIGLTYSPDRYKGPMRREGDALSPTSWEEASALLADKIRANPGGVYVLGRDPGPTAGEVIDRFVTGVGAGGRVVYDPFANEALRAATRQVFGVASQPRFDLSGADLVIDFGSDFLETGASPVEQARDLAEARSVDAHEGGGARFVYVGPRLSMTGSKADEWIAAKPGTEGILALGIARAAVEAGGGEALTALARFDAASVAEKTGVEAAAIERLGRAVAEAEAPVALPPGVALSSRRAVATAAAVLLLNHVAGAQGNTLFVPDAPAGAVASHRDLSTLIDAMKAGRVSVLLIHDANPVHSIPADMGFAEALAKVPFVVSFATVADETSEAAHLVLPDHSPLESWGDSSPRPGVRSLVQPAVAPLYDTRATEDVLLETARALGASVPAGTFHDVLKAAWSGIDFNAALARGGEFSDASAPAERGLAAGAANLEVGEPPLEGDGDLVLVAHPHPLLGDGADANLPWLQEVADPVTKVSWISWAEIAKETAERLGVDHGDLVSVETPAGTAELPVVPRGGIRPDVVAIAIGQGHTVGHYASGAMDGRPGEKRGVNVLDLLPARADENGGRAYLTVRARLSATGGFRQMPLWQKEDNQRDRVLGRQVSLLALAKGEAGAAYPSHGGEHGAGHDEAGAGHEEAAAHGDGGAAAVAGPDPHVYRPYDMAGDSESADYRWGMSIDVDRCTGCSACIAACYIENNVPIVGEKQTAWGRHMPWLRIDRYVGDGEATLEAGRNPIENHEELGKTDVRHVPMVCQQCGSAPCEPVCPVFATYHNAEGLNGMVYNRCIGTRYCANNCSYKVRRFNYYDYQIETWPDPMPLMLNPDVTVRGQGVMEKCTFCVQRIHTARQDAKDAGRLIADGEVQTACQQSCPTEAIHFGNVKDANSTVVRRSEDPVRGYHALHDLNTRPAVTYLAQVERGKVEG